MNADHLVGWTLVALGLWATVAIIAGALVLALVEALKPWADRTVAAHIEAADAAEYPELDYGHPHMWREGER